MTSIWLVSFTRAILRRAEFGFLGVIVRTCRQTPRFCGAPGIGTWRWRRLFQFLRMAGALIFEIFGVRPWRTSWLIVGTKTLLLSDVLLVREPRRSSSGQARDGTLIKWSGGWPLGLVGAHADRGPLPRPRSRSVSAARKSCQTRFPFSRRLRRARPRPISCQMPARRALGGASAPIGERRLHDHARELHAPSTRIHRDRMVMQAARDRASPPNAHQASIWQDRGASRLRVEARRRSEAAARRARPSRRRAGRDAAGREATSASAPSSSGSPASAAAATAASSASRCRRLPRRRGTG